MGEATSAAIAASVASLSAVVADKVFNAIPGSETFALATSDNPLRFIEHYHIGLALLAIDGFYKSWALRGAGATFLLIEALQANPFGAGKDDYSVRGNIALTALETGLVIIGHSK